MPRHRLTMMLVLLIALATAAFAVGAAIERSGHHSESTLEATKAPEGGRGSGNGAEGGSSEAPSVHRTESQSEHASESLLGLDPEAPGLVVAAVIASLLLALAVLDRPEEGLLLLLIAAAMLLFGALDVREVIHQVDESNAGLAALASAIAALHLAAAGLALFLVATRSVRPGQG